MRSVFVFMIFLIACTRHENDGYRYRTVIVNDSLKTVLQSYINETNLNRESSYVVLTYRDRGSREEYRISAGNSTAYRNFPPDYYAQLNGATVLLYLTGDDFLNKDDVRKDLDRYFGDQKIILNDIVRAYDPATWILTKCLDSYELIKTIDPHPVMDLPCNTF